MQRKRLRSSSTAAATATAAAATTATNTTPGAAAAAAATTAAAGALVAAGVAGFKGCERGCAAAEKLHEQLRLTLLTQQLAQTYGHLDVEQQWDKRGKGGEGRGGGALRTKG